MVFKSDTNFNIYLLQAIIKANSDDSISAVSDDMSGMAVAARCET